MRRILPSLLLLALPLLSGCATSRLWSPETLLVTAGPADGRVSFHGDASRRYRNAAGDLAYPGRLSQIRCGKLTDVEGLLIVPKNRTDAWLVKLNDNRGSVPVRKKADGSDFIAYGPLDQYPEAVAFEFIATPDTENPAAGFVRDDLAKVTRPIDDNRYKGPFSINYNPVRHTPESDALDTAAKVVATPVTVATDGVLVAGSIGAYLILGPLFILGSL